MRLVIVEYLKIFFLQVSNCAALLVADDNGDKDFVDIEFNPWGITLRLTLLLSGGLAAWNECEGTQD
jgi:hypothetical protein